MNNTTVALDLCACFKVLIEPEKNRALRYSLGSLTAPTASDGSGQVSPQPVRIDIPRSDIQIIHALPPAPESSPTTTDEALDILQNRFAHALHLRLVATTLQANLARNPADETSARIAMLLAPSPLTWVSGPHYEFLVTDTQADIARSVPALSVDAQAILRIPEVAQQNHIVDTSPLQRPDNLPRPMVAFESITNFRSLPEDYATQLATIFQMVADGKDIKPQHIKTMLMLGDHCRILAKDDPTRIGLIVNSWKESSAPSPTRLN